ncbi:hypothetical protein GCM10009527_004950 [Actinomadura nitritigenes]|uniref:Peptidase inhibitor family I36 n=1 Tax=Actinomadura nitritigenes TaxID=134602 RepID=A0ABS3RGC2_9ACTN|nr:hypothetical protein [Actinomadura nitritigenes]MBO2444639.1 hypothetical protein [Actinomadura nitritigenes]
MSSTTRKATALASALALTATGTLAPGNAASAATATTRAKAEAPAARKGCGANLPATPARWTYARGSCALLGRPGAWHGFRWTATDSYAALQVRTYNTRGQAYWVKCGSGGGHCQVPIGNNAFTPLFRAWNALRVSHIYIAY